MNTRTIVDLINENVYKNHVYVVSRPCTKTVSTTLIDAQNKSIGKVPAVLVFDNHGKAKAFTKLVSSTDPAHWKNNKPLVKRLTARSLLTRCNYNGIGIAIVQGSSCEMQVYYPLITDIDAYVFHLESISQWLDLV